MTRFEVSGMSCGHCVAAVTRAVQARYPAASVKVDLPTGRVDVDGDVDAALVRQAIEEEGYGVRS